MSKKWYVVHTYSGHEDKVRENLRKAIEPARSAELEASFGDILVAKEEFVEMRDGKARDVRAEDLPLLRPTFGGWPERRDAPPGAAERPGGNRLHRAEQDARRPQENEVAPRPARWEARTTSSCRTPELLRG